MSQIHIKDFLPSYPNIHKSEYPLLNPYEEPFETALYKKKEFYDDRLEKIEKYEDVEPGRLLKHQKIIAKFLSSHTLYDGIILVHEMGSGKTCSVIGSIEQIKYEDNNFERAYIFVKGKNIKENFEQELRDRCTKGQYIPPDFNTLSHEQKVRKTRKLYRNFYSINHFVMFAQQLQNMDDKDIVKTFSNCIFVIDEVQNLREKDKDMGKVDVYKQFHRLFHLPTNTKKVLMSGTPMKNSIDELPSVMNLLLPLNNQLPTGEQFKQEFLQVIQPAKESKLLEMPPIYSIKTEKMETLKTFLRGRVSFLKAMESDVKSVYVGEKRGLEHLIVQPSMMSEFQTKYYNEAIEKDKGRDKEEEGKEDSKDEDKKEDKKERLGFGVYINTRQASLFVYPDGTYGSEGFKKYMKKESGKKMGTDKEFISYTLDPSFKKELKGENDAETLQNIQKYSTKYAYVINQIISNKTQNMFVYNKFNTGSGSILFTKLLKLFGYTEARGNETKPGLRFAYLTGDSSSSPNIRRLVERFNRKDNKNGKYIQLIIGSDVVVEGLSFRNIRQEFILTPWFNFSEITQAIARGIRYKSHDEKNITVEINLCVSIPTSGPSLDMEMYRLSEDKDISIMAMMRLLMEIAFDCALNYNRNKIEGKDGTRDCFYGNCEYTCNGIDMKMIDNVPVQEIDYSTYQLYYSDPKVSAIRKILENLFLENNTLTTENILNHFKNDPKNIFTEFEILNAIRALINKSKENLLYKDYIQEYYKSNVEQILKIVRELFREYFSMSLSEIENVIQERGYYTKFEIITCLRKVINESIIIKDKYGFSCYMKEENNTYYLVNSLLSKSSETISYYTEYPNIIANKSFNDIFLKIQDIFSLKIVNYICETKDPKQFSNFIDLLHEDLVETVIEKAIEAKVKDTNETLVNLVLNHFNAYIHYFPKQQIYMSLLFEYKDNLRCYYIEDDEWRDCPASAIELLEEKERKTAENLKKRDYYGTYLPEDNTFRIVSVAKEKESEKKRIKAYEADVKKGKITREEMIEKLKVPDLRRKYTGENAWTMSIPKLLTVIHYFKIDPDGGEYDDVKMKAPSATFKKILGKDLEDENVLRLQYWKEQKKDGMIPAIKKYFEENDLLKRNTKYGQIKDKLRKKETEIPKIRIKMLVPESTDDWGVKYSNKVSKTLEDCAGTRVPITKSMLVKEWIIVFIKKNIAGILILDENDGVERICLHSKYVENISPYLSDFMKRKCAKDLFATVENTKVKKVLKWYKIFGFGNVVTGDTHTTLRFTCKKKKKKLDVKEEKEEKEEKKIERIEDLSEFKSPKKIEKEKKVKNQVKSSMTSNEIAKLLDKTEIGWLYQPEDNEPLFNFIDSSEYSKLFTDDSKGTKRLADIIIGRFENFVETADEIYGDEELIDEKYRDYWETFDSNFNYGKWDSKETATYLYGKVRNLLTREDVGDDVKDDVGDDVKEEIITQPIDAGKLIQDTNITLLYQVFNDSPVYNYVPEEEYKLFRDGKGTIFLADKIIDFAKSFKEDIISGEEYEDEEDIQELYEEKMEEFEASLDEKVWENKEVAEYLLTEIKKVLTM